MRIAAWVLLLTCLAAGQAPTVNWSAQEPEILRHYSSLVQIDSSNPPGNETLVVNYLKTVFDAEGIPSQVFALDPARANLVARIKGNGSKRPILIMAHTDGVGVQREKWPVDPFGAIRKGGYIRGRGTVDDKDKLAANLMLMLLLNRTSAKLGTWETPLRLNDTTRTYFERLAGISSPEAAARYNGITDPRRGTAIQRCLAENEPMHYSMLRTSVIPTILKAGFRMNVIPSQAEATIDDGMAATDMAFLRAKGMQSYGIGPVASDADRTNYGTHSDVERRLESSLYSFTRFTWEAVLEVSASK